jgi:hypothetical protein
MSRVPYLLAPLLAGAVFFLTGSMEPTAAPVLSIPGPALPRSLEPWSGNPRPLPPALRGVTAAALLDRASAAYGPDKVAWLDMKFRQQVANDDLNFEVEGRFLSGPAQRVRYELRVKIGTETSHFVTLCDGDRLLEMAELPGQKKEVSSAELPRIQHPTDDPAAVASLRHAMLEGKTFPGLPALLASLRRGLVQPELRLVTVQGHDLLEIRGNWTRDPQANEPLPEDLRGRDDVGACRVFLDAATLWPRCVEWWGRGSDGNAAPLLVQTVYELTSLNQPLTGAQAAREFPTTLPGER